MVYEEHIKICVQIQALVSENRLLSGHMIVQFPLIKLLGYGSVTGSGATGSPPDGALEKVVDSLVEEFVAFTGICSRRDARRYIIDNGLDLHQATNAYFLNVYGN